MSKASTLDFEVLKQPSAKSVTNLCNNGEFETNTTGWTALNSATLTRVTTEKYFGAASMQITHGSNLTNAFASFDYTPGGVIPVKNYYVLVRFKGTVAASRGLSLTIQEIGGATGTQSNSSGSAITNTGIWQIASLSRTLLQSDRTTLRLQLVVTGPLIGDFTYIDSVQIIDDTVMNIPGGPGYLPTDFAASATSPIIIPFGTPSPVLLPPTVRFVSATLSVVGSDSVFIGKKPIKTVAASGASTTTLARLVSKIASVVGTSTITLARTPSHTLSVNDSGITSIKKFPSITKSVSGIGNGLLQRVATHTLSSNNTVAATVVRLLARQLSAIGVSHEALSVLPSTTLRTNDVVNPSICRSVTKTLTVVVLGSALVALQPLVVLMATINGVSSIIRRISRTLSSVINGSSSVDKQLGRDISTLNIGTATVVKTPKIRLLAVGEGLASLTRLFIDRSEFLLRITASYTRVYAESTKRWAIDMYRRIS